MTSAADWLKLKEGDKCSTCTVSYAACTRRILDRGVGACCGECKETDTHNERMRLSEDDFKRKVMEYAKLRGWMVCHYRPARTEHGWRTPLEGDKGCPDLILARRGYLLLVELKSSGGRLASEQMAWAQALGDNYRLWRPRDWALIEMELK
jgi:hypothetical protein